MDINVILNGLLVQESLMEHYSLLLGNINLYIFVDHACMYVYLTYIVEQHVYLL